MSATDVLDDPVMFLPEVVRIVRQSPTTIWRQEKQGKFPPRHYDGRYAAWFRSQIAAHQELLRANASGSARAPSKQMRPVDGPPVGSGQANPIPEFRRAGASNCSGSPRAARRRYADRVSEAQHECHGA